MCGRGDQSLTFAEICELAGVVGAVPATNLEPRYNIAPTTSVHIVRMKDGERVVEKATWDLVPGWWKKPLSEKKFRTHNARAETLQDKATFRAAWKNSQRCIIPMNFFAGAATGGRPLGRCFLLWEDGLLKWYHSYIWTFWCNVCFRLGGAANFFQVQCLE